MTLNPNRLLRRGMILIISSPSGAGKTTLAQAILEKDFNIQRSISVTDRPARANERDGIDYFFVTPERFTEMVKEDAFLEHTENHGGIRYGTPRMAVEETLAAGRDLLFVIDVKGAAFLRERAREHVVSIFVLPPSITELRKRLELRGDDDDSVILKRLTTAQSEFPCATEYDYVIMNDDLSQATARVEAILKAERQKAHRFKNLETTLDTLMAELKLFL